MPKETYGLKVLQSIIIDNYDLGNVELPAHVENAHQRRHRKLIITTSHGKFLVKTYRRDPYVLDTLRFQHRLSDHLQNNNLPVAQIRRARNGKRIVEVDDWALELQQFVEGEGMRINAQTLARSAKALGRFHHVCRDFPRPERDANIWRFSEVPRKPFAKLYECARNQGNVYAIDEYCNGIAFFLQNARNKLDLNARSDFETGLIHGDWHSGNLIFRGNELVAIVDMEFAGDGCFLEDLAYAISNLCIRTSSNIEHLERRTDLVLRYYRKYRTLSFGEEVALYYAVGVKHVTTVSYQILQNKGEVAGLNASEWMEILHKQCAWLEEKAQKSRWGM